MSSSTYLAEKLAKAPALIIACIHLYVPPHPGDNKLIEATHVRLDLPGCLESAVAPMPASYRSVACSAEPAT